MSPVNVCELLPTLLEPPVKSMAVPASALVRLLANLIVSASTRITNNAVLSAILPLFCARLVPP